MEKYTIAYVPVSPEDMPQNAADIGNPFENNRSIYACIAMILNKDINEVKRKKPHYHLYGKYLGGFLFESIDLQQARSDSNRSVWDELRDFETVEAPEMLRKCGLETGMTVLDLGCGHAHYTIPASLAAGKEGRVIAVDISKKAIREAEKRTSGLNAAEIIFMNTDENGLTEYAGRIDFLMVYDVLHGAEWKDNKDEKIKKLHSLLKERSILSLALYSEIERKPDPLKNPTAKGSVSTVAISHEEAIKPYIEMIESCGFRLHTVVYNGGVHFDNFHSPYHWRKYGEVRITSLERRPVYNFIKE